MLTDTKGDLNRLRDFYEEYMIALDDANFSLWVDFFTQDAQYKIISRENFQRGLPMGAMSCDGIGMIKDRVTALEKVLVFEPRSWRRFLSSVRIKSIDGDVIVAGANFLLYECLRDREPQLNMLGEYHDRLVRDGDGFRFKERICVYDNDRIITTLFAPV